MLANWLSTVQKNETSSYFTNVFQSSDNFPNLKEAKIVIFTRDVSFSKALRQCLSELHNHFESEIIDIGTLNSDNSSSIYQVISELQDGYILPVLIGIDQGTFFDFCRAMQIEQKLITATYVSNKIVLPREDYELENIGFQRHLVAKHNHEETINSHSPGLSLGALRTSQKILEPILRETNYLHFDLAAIRRSECPNNTKSYPTGLYTEEACQIMRYAGEGHRLKLVTFDVCDLNDEHTIEASIVAELIWYLHEGMDVKKDDHPAISSDFKEFIIELNDINHSLVFMQSNKSGKWWLKKDNDSNRYISCAYEEYQESITNEIPDRLLKLL